MRRDRLVLSLALTGFLLLGSLVSVSGAPRRVALVIGNAAYREGRLRNPVNDATDIAATLRQLEFDVTLLRDTSLQKMEEALTTFSRHLRQGGIGLFYFAGHGVQVQGENYLIPLGAHLDRAQDVRYQAMPVGRVLGAMEDAQNGLNIIILDACRNNPFARSWRSSQRGLVAVQAVKGSLIAYATAPGSVAADGEGRNGLYTQYLLRAMTTPGLYVEQMFKQVRVAVQRNTGGKQTPWESSSLVGNFTFKEVTPPAPVVSTPPPVPQRLSATPASPEPEAVMWVVIEDSTYPEDFQDFLAAYPSGRYAPAARAKLKRLQRQQKKRQRVETRRREEEPQRPVQQQTQTPPQVARLDPDVPKQGVKIGRFIKYDNGTALDTKTNLMWMTRDFRNIEGRAPDWKEAMAWAATMNQQRYGGYSDWRVPTEEEYKQILRPKDSDPAPFEDRGGKWFWTETAGCPPTGPGTPPLREGLCPAGHWLATAISIRTGKEQEFDGDSSWRMSIHLVRHSR